MAVKILSVPKVKKGRVIEEGNPAYAADRIAQSKRHIEKRGTATLKKHREKDGKDPEAVQKEIDRRAGLGSRNRDKSQKVRNEKLQELEDLRELGVVPDATASVSLATEDRRREVYKLYLRGFNQTLIAEVFSVSRVTINEDLKVMKKKLIEELTSLGAEGLVTKSYSMYELLQHETIKYLDNLKEGNVKDALSLIRLAKDIEDSKTRLLSSIGAIKTNKIQNAQSIVHGNTAGAPMVSTNEMMTVLTRIQNRIKASTAEDAEIVDE